VGSGAGGGAGLVRLVWRGVTVGALGGAYYVQGLRAELGGTRTADHVRTARAKGLPERAVLLRHALRPALGPLVTVVGLDLGVLLGGAVVTEVVFAWPGLGRELVAAIAGADLPLIAGAVLVSAVAIALANLLADVVVAILDPRVRDD